jgi:hypothetical protein
MGSASSSPVQPFDAAIQGTQCATERFMHRAAELYGLVSMKGGTLTSNLSIDSERDRRGFKALAWAYSCPFPGYRGLHWGGRALVLFCAAALWGAPGLLLYGYGLDEAVAGLLVVPLRPSMSALLLLAFATAYLVTTALLLASVVLRLASGRTIGTRVLICAPAVPAILVSWCSMLATCFLFFFALVTWCIPWML